MPGVAMSITLFDVLLNLDLDIIRNMALRLADVVPPLMWHRCLWCIKAWFIYSIIRHIQLSGLPLEPKCLDNRGSTVHIMRARKECMYIIITSLIP